MAVRAHLRGAIDYSKVPLYGWAAKEHLIFEALEQELLAEFEAMIYQQHVAIASTSYGNAFTDELEGVKSAYTKYGRLRAPWLQWRKARTLAEQWLDHCKAVQEPEYKAELARLQAELDELAAKTTAAVQAELEVRAAAREYYRKRAEKARKPLGRRYGRSKRRR